MTKLNLIICNQIAIMEALKVLMAHNDRPELGKMTNTWQFDQLKKMVEESQK
jgi:hypothetical protein